MPPASQFEESVRTDPLFSAEGLDLDRASQALDALESALSDLESVLSKDSWSRRLFLVRYPLARYAVPVPFLRAFLESERARRVFIASPAAENAQQVLAGWRAASRAYRESIKRYTRLHYLFYRIEKKKDTFVFNDMVGNRTTLVDVDRTLELMMRNAEALEQAVRERGQMLAGSVSPAGTPPDFFPLPEFRKGGISPECAHLHALEMQHSPLMQGEILETYGPLRYTMAHFDGLPAEHLFMLYIMRDPVNGLESAKLSLVDRFYFLPIAGPRARFGGIGKSSFELLIKRGLRYWFQPATSLYAARDQRYWADIATVVDRVRRPDLNWKLAEPQRSSLFDLILGAGVNDVHIFIAHTQERIATGDFKQYSLLFGLLMRSHPSIYFLPFNRSVWRIPERPNFIGSGRISEEDQIYLTEQAVINDTTPEEMELIMQGGRIRREERQKAAKFAGI